MIKTSSWAGPRPVLKGRPHGSIPQASHSALEKGLNSNERPNGRAIGQNVRTRVGVGVGRGPVLALSSQIRLPTTPGWETLQPAVHTESTLEEGYINALCPAGREAMVRSGSSCQSGIRRIPYVEQTFSCEPHCETRAGVCTVVSGGKKVWGFKQCRVQLPSRLHRI
jgi:hypothetical protein